MTVLIAVRRESFAVMASERLQHRSGPNGDVAAALNPKLFAHPRLPIALGTVGLALLQDGTNLSEKLGALLESTVGTATPSASEMLSRVESALHEAVEASLRELHTHTPDVPGRNKFRVYAATVRANRAELETMEIRDGVTDRLCVTAMLAAPDCLHAFYGDMARYPDGTLFGATIGGALALGAHLGEVVADGVDEEARIHGGQNIHCGRPIDAVVVSPRGARFVRLTRPA